MQKKICSRSLFLGGFFLLAIVGGVFMEPGARSDSFIRLWEKEADNIPWFKRWTKTLNQDTLGALARWFIGGELNASHACLDVHIQNGRGTHKALIWENELGESVTFTYLDLYDEVNRMAYVLKNMGVRQGDVVIVYLPMIPEAVIALLAIARLGAVHSVVFSGFGAHALKDRINDTAARYVITAEAGTRRGKIIPLKRLVDEALCENTEVKKVLIVRSSSLAASSAGDAHAQTRDIFYSAVRPETSVIVPPVHVESNHPLFVLYTSGTTGKPKGIVHSTGGYLTHCFSSFKWTFAPNPEDVYWCTADIGWITGHSYVVYAPLMHGLTVLMHEGTPDWPDAGTWWKLLEKHRVTIFYTSPTAIRMAMRAGNSWSERYNLSSLRMLGSVGEPINPEAWDWYYMQIGRSRCPIIDTWWQTETGGFMIAPMENTMPLKPGSATRPLPGINARIVDGCSGEAAREAKGFLVITDPWPGMSIGIYGDEKRFEEIYFSKFPGMFYTGDFAYSDADGYFWILGRADEVIKVAGHRAGMAEIESAALTQKSIVEVAAIGISDAVKGEQVVLFVTLKGDAVASDALTREIVASVREQIGAFVTPSAVYYVKSIPKTRSGKIMRRLLKNVVEGNVLGDMTTLDDEGSFEELRVYYDAIKREIGAKRS